MKVLVVRFRALGDCVMAAWPVSAIRSKYPESHITWVVERTCAAMVDESRLVNEVVSFPRDKWKRDRSKISTLADQWRHYARLRGQNYDLGIDLQGHLKTAMALRVAKPKRRVAVQATDGFTRLLNPVPLHREPMTHWVDHHMTVLRTLESFPDVVRPSMPPLPQVAQLPRRPFISICTGGSSDRKRYPLESWQRVADALHAKGIQVVGIGGPDDPLLDGPHLNLQGQLTLRESMAVIAQSQAHIAPDTGTGHMAAALGIPVVSLFVDDEVQVRSFRPYTPSAFILRASTVAEIEPTAVAEAALKIKEPAP